MAIQRLGRLRAFAASQAFGLPRPLRSLHSRRRPAIGIASAPAPRHAGVPHARLAWPVRRLPIALALTLAAVVVGAMPGAAPSARAATAVLGYDVSWPNCSQAAPSGTVLSIVGVTGGRAFTHNPCLRSEYLAARRKGVVRFYMNLNSPTGTIGMTGPAGRCSTTNLSCQAFNYGYHAAAAAWSYAVQEIGWAPLRTRWWVDVELMNRWSSHPAVNARVVAGALHYLTLRRDGVLIRANRVGVYSTDYQWRTIAGAYRPTFAAVWYATVARTVGTAASYCRSAYAFTGGSVAMVQYLPGGIDRDDICP